MFLDIPMLDCDGVVTHRCGSSDPRIDPSEIRVWVKIAGKQPGPADLQDEDVDNLEWGAKMGTAKYH